MYNRNSLLSTTHYSKINPIPSGDILQVTDIFYIHAVKKFE